MKHNLNILHVEDNQDDAVLIRRELFKFDLEIYYKLVDDAQSLTASLKEKKWDIVICDFTLPSFSGLDALKIIRDYDFELPVIFVSSTMDDHIVSLVLNEGAFDYVGKNNLVKLIPAIRQYFQNNN